MSTTIGRPYWHIHHEFLVEFATEPIANRIKYIREEKPKHEIATRLRLLKPVKGRLPAKVLKAWAACDQARAARDQARAAYVKACGAYDQAAYDQARAALAQARAAYAQAWAALAQAIRECMPSIEKLHAKECPGCPWNGRTIFP